uniref:Myosin phosphatase Rho interacting protein n=1 Tax=Gasterosteus aculeatus aculeatus TaxID=481459 RepID=A0AAQ4QRY6_GASAC
MSAAKENPCRKFQANFFNKSKCQNCFKPRELHLLTDQDLTQHSRLSVKTTWGVAAGRTDRWVQSGQTDS